jgi:3-dehydroquinate synthase
MLKSKIQTITALPKLSDLNISSKNNAIIFYDQKLLKNLFIKTWLQNFSFKIALNAGESLKTLDSYSAILKKISALPIQKNTTFVSLGGGSVGDFVGFVASTYKRGQRLVHIPSTWLSAVDSAHGGKTGLNFLEAKNQIGTFYPAEIIILSQKLLFSQPVDRICDAYGEFFKIGLINQPAILKQPKISADYLWKNLNAAILGKYKIVELDPYEKTGLRQVLNLGHTMGHVFEVCLGISHGQAVLLGLMFSARYSFQLGYLKKAEFIKICQILFSVPLKIKFNKVLKISDQKIKKLLLQDKKKTTSNDEVNFVFIQPVKISDLISEVQRQRRQL